MCEIYATTYFSNLALMSLILAYSITFLWAEFKAEAALAGKLPIWLVVMP